MTITACLMTSWDHRALGFSNMNLAQAGLEKDSCFVFFLTELICSVSPQSHLLCCLLHCQREAEQCVGTRLHTGTHGVGWNGR